MTSNQNFVIFQLLALLPFLNQCVGETEVGPLVDRNSHAVSGTVFIVDDSTLLIKNFNYDGTAPDAFFYVGTSGSPSESGTKLEYPEGQPNAILGAFNGQSDVTVKLPSSLRAQDLRWLSVWCRAFDVNFGEVTFPDRLKFPRPQKISGLDGIHDVKSDR